MFAPSTSNRNRKCNSFRLHGNANNFLLNTTTTKNQANKLHVAAEFASKFFPLSCCRISKNEIKATEVTIISSGKCFVESTNESTMKSEKKIANTHTHVHSESAKITKLQKRQTIPAKLCKTNKYLSNRTATTTTTTTSTSQTKKRKKRHLSSTYEATRIGSSWLVHTVV